jgi:hypothetical protein
MFGSIQSLKMFLHLLTWILKTKKLIKQINKSKSKLHKIFLLKLKTVTISNKISTAVVKIKETKCTISKATKVSNLIYLTLKLLNCIEVHLLTVS